MNVVSSQRSVVSKSVFCIALSAMLFALCLPVDGQQTGKVARIGFLDNGTASGSAVLEAFSQELSNLGWIEGKISPSSTGLPSKRTSVFLSLRRSWFVLRLT